jgi:hypothetical protein
MRLEDYSIDDLHLIALAEFELDPEAQEVFNAVYEAMLHNYVAAVQLLRLRRQSNLPWESATQ